MQGYPPNFQPNNQYTSTVQNTTTYNTQQTGYPPSGYPPSGYPPQQLTQQTNQYQQTTQQQAYPQQQQQNTGYPPSNQQYQQTNQFQQTTYQQPQANTGYPPQQQTQQYQQTTQQYTPTQQQTGYPPQQTNTGYPPNAQQQQKPGYPPTQQNTGYPPQQQQASTSYPQSNTGYAPQTQQTNVNVGYQHTVSPQQKQGYPPTSNTGYPPQQQQQTQLYQQTTQQYTPTTQQHQTPTTGFDPYATTASPTGYPNANASAQATNINPYAPQTQQQQPPSSAINPYAPSPQNPPAPTQNPYAPPQSTPPPSVNPYAQTIAPPTPQTQASLNPYAHATAQPQPPSSAHPYGTPPVPTQPPPNPQATTTVQQQQQQPPLTSTVVQDRDARPSSQPPPSRPRDAPQAPQRPVTGPSATATSSGGRPSEHVLEQQARAEAESVQRLKDELALKQEQERKKRTEIMTHKKEFFAHVIEQTQIIANNANRVAGIIADSEYNDLLVPDSMTREFFSDVLALIQTLASQLHSEIGLNALEVEDFVQQLLAENTLGLQAKVVEMVMDCASFLDKTSAITKLEDLASKVTCYIQEINSYITKLLKEIQKLQRQIQEIEEDDFDEGTEVDKQNMTTVELGKQLLIGESNYLRSLSGAVEKWVQPLKASIYDKRPLATKTQVDKLNILEKICEVSTGLVQALQLASIETHARFGDVFIEQISHLQLYVNYALTFDEVVKVIDELYGSGLNKEFIKWHTAQKATLKAGDLDMSDMFLAPLARMGRYYAFLRNLERKTERDSIDFPVIEKACQIVQEMNTSVSKKKQQFESQVKMQNLLSKMKSTIPVDFLVNKHVVYDGLLEFKREGIERRRGRFWLFQDSMLLTQFVINPSGKLDDHYYQYFNFKDITLFTYAIDSREAKKREKRGFLNTLNFDAPEFNRKTAVAPHLKNDNDLFIVDEVDFDYQKTLRFDEYEDIYKQDYHHTRHFVFIANNKPQLSAQKVNDPVQIFHVSSTPNNNGNYLTLRTNGKGYQNYELKVGKDRKTPFENVHHALELLYPDVYLVNPAETQKFNTDFSLLESSPMYSQKVTKFKIGVHFVPMDAGRSLSEQDKDAAPSAEFWTFLNVMGRKIHTNGWTGYKGDVNDGVTYYDDYLNKEVVYHVAPLLSPQEHRRYIGNDLLHIIFLEQDRAIPYDTIHCTGLGSMAASFAVVQPVGTKYRLTFFHSRSMHSTFPKSPGGELDAQQMKLVLLTKLHNDMVMSRYCAPWNRLFFLPRIETLAEIVKKFPRDVYRNPDHIQKKSLLHPLKGETYPTAGDTNATPSFELNYCDEGWKFYCSPGSLAKWVHSIEQTMNAWRVIASMEQQIAAHAGPNSSTSAASGSTVANANTGASKTNLGGNSSLPEARRMIIVNATYGKLGDMKKSIDVTKQIQALVNQQGGDRLELKAGTKKTMFGGDADKVSKGKKAHLAIIYKANGETFRHTFKDEDFVDLKTSTGS